MNHSRSESMFGWWSRWMDPSRPGPARETPHQAMRRRQRDWQDYFATIRRLESEGRLPKLSADPADALPRGARR